MAAKSDLVHESDSFGDTLNTSSGNKSKENDDLCVTLIEQISRFSEKLEAENKLKVNQPTDDNNNNGNINQRPIAAPSPEIREPRSTLTMDQILRLRVSGDLKRCDYCGKLFGDLVALEKHLNIHFRERFHQCEFCQYCFVHSSRFYEHMQTHAGEDVMYYGDE